MRTVRLDFRLRRMSVLPRVLLLVGRLGGTVQAVSAADGRVELTIDAPDEVAHRLGPQIGRIVEVTEIHESAAQTLPAGTHSPPVLRDSNAQGGDGR